MKMLNRTTVIWTIILLLVATGSFFIGKYSSSLLSFGRNNQHMEPIFKNEPLAKCNENDKSCLTRNEKIILSKLSGPAVEYAKHQCDSSRGCKTPDEKTVEAAISAIRTYAKDPKLELLLINGINPLEIAYYCSEDNRCWGFNTKSSQVIHVSQ